ncbi:hypothetical protein K2173_000723 [Erythroxylum novogranatense]|uniref:Hydroxyproline-rich glycoprotein family protein n=1 Tax=Erythroxylum novogranatense TaxID=1862640 RepID=A0AAV8SID2_9ROSI|nr:hypothetical protein K2173_000723 [Erythroxylum novogranatense]
MKSPLAKLRGFKLHKNDGKDKRDIFPSAMLDELAQASQDMQEMRNCYDSLLSAAAATANSAYEFSESLREMGSCLLEKTALHDDEETGKILFLLGKVQFELQKLVDSYRSHVFLTITNPSESLLNELRTVEDMKRQCDEKRSIYEYMLAQPKEKGTPKSGKGESFKPKQLQAAHNEFDDEAALCIFRLKSLKQGQLRSLLTQAARHHAAQLNFFRRGLKSLEAVEPHVRLVTEQQHIDYQFSGLEDDSRNDGEDDSGNGDNVYESRELSFDYRQTKLGHDAISTSINSMELNSKKVEENIQVREHKGGSHSAPIFPDRKPEFAERLRQIQQSTPQKSNSYVLPTPIDAKASLSSKPSNVYPLTRPTDLSGPGHSLWHSSPLEQKRQEKDSSDGNPSEFALVKTHAAINSVSGSNQLPPRLPEGVPVLRLDTYTPDNEKMKRQSFSGPIIGKQYTTKHASFASGPIPSNELFQQVPGVLSRAPVPQPTASPKVSPSASPPFASSPKISELHELPRPPGGLATNATKSVVPITHSAPLVRNPEPPGASKSPSLAKNRASRLPTPPLLVSRSYSIPSSSQRAMTVHVSKLLESPKALSKAKEVDSPPLTPISLANMKAESSNSELIAHSGQNRGGS